MFAGVKALASRYAKKRMISQKEAERQMKAFFEVLHDELLNAENEGIQIIDFLTLKRVVRKSKIGRNPRQPGVEFVIPENVSIKCELGKTFKDELNH